MEFIAEAAISYPFSFDVRGNVLTAASQDALWKDRVFLAVSTSLGERVMRPTYGIGSADELFDGQTAADERLRRDITSLFSESFPLLVLREIVTSYDEKLATLSIDISYTLPNQEEVSTSIGLVNVNGNNPPYEETI